MQSPREDETRPHSEFSLGTTVLLLVDFVMHSLDCYDGFVDDFTV